MVRAGLPHSTQDDRSSALVQCGPIYLTLNNSFYCFFHLKNNMLQKNWKMQKGEREIPKFTQFFPAETAFLPC